MSDVWQSPHGDPRTGGNPEGEKATYAEYLDHFRKTLALKCEDLTPEQLATRSVPPSSLSLLGLVRHLAKVEHFWFVKVARGVDEPRLYGTDEQRDRDFDGVEPTQECVDEALATWGAQIAAAESWFKALPEEGLGRELPIPGRDEVTSVRDLVVHMIEEYARHCGHADLLRECLDGRTGQ
ncbi:DinB family protein [Aeromicrobium sp. CTD01-1L150]|uniref:DinB family protein n=1 Tax=Aeromicrobium sp. CTD01-1L150 TaxID=3341830 RepID=UPI0035C0CF16